MLFSYGSIQGKIEDDFYK